VLKGLFCGTSNIVLEPAPSGVVAAKNVYLRG
jgi:hypothetical protein